jgi:cysteinyl-tRNA synthetase
MFNIYNTLTRKKEAFVSIEKNKVKMYVCGPTVYDYFHLGNARSFIMSDIIRRYLEYKGYEVTFVMNLTDVDDKIINKANSEGKSPQDIAEIYSKAFFEDIDKLRIKRASVNPKATEHMEEIVSLISDLEEKGFAYNVEGNVFYDVVKFKEYGKLSGKNIADLESGARVEINESKKNPLDFSLWKKAKPGEPSWQSPWGNGRPGWHIECSAMSCKHLGESFDIHAGGNDLIFPHHENEIAQSEASTGKQFAKYWMHFGFLNIDNEKMSKSLGNFFTTREVLKVYSAGVIRLFFSQTHYAGPLNYSDSLLEASKKGLEKIENVVYRLNELLKSSSSAENVNFDITPFNISFEEAMDDDFNTSKATAVIFDFAKEVNRFLDINPKIGVETIEKLRLFLSRTAQDVLGIIDLSTQPAVQSNKILEDKLIQLLIELRTQAKKDKNFSLSDKIRDELKELGITLQDSKEGTTYKVSEIL